MSNNSVLNEDVKKYELMLIVDPEIGLDSIKKRLDDVTKMITKKGKEAKGEIFFQDDWGMRDLSYSIKKRTKGYYMVFDFTCEPALIKDFDRTLRLENDVLRHMIITLPFAYEPKSLAVMMEEAAKEEALKPPREDKKGGRAPMRPAPVAAPVKKEEKAEVKVEKKAPAKKEKEEKKETSMEEVDAKLKSIIDNPDLNF
ncbi:30S ribosomal protein S6 [Candidatus Peregrinibacteria bacterium]|nr:30S ribosomal protein S6 [Candidatus Peregrinibacteria bacterium]